MPPRGGGGGGGDHTPPCPVRSFIHSFANSLLEATGGCSGPGRRRGDEGGSLGPALRRDLEVGAEEHRPGLGMTARPGPAPGRGEGTGFHSSPEGSHHSLGALPALARCQQTPLLAGPCGAGWGRPPEPQRGQEARPQRLPREPRLLGPGALGDPGEASTPAPGPGPGAAPSGVGAQGP